MAVVAAPFQAPLFLAADHGDVIAPVQERHAHADIDRVQLPGRLDQGGVDGLALLRAKGIDHPRRQAIEQGINLNRLGGWRFGDRSVSLLQGFSLARSAFRDPAGSKFIRAVLLCP